MNKGIPLLKMCWITNIVMRSSKRLKMAHCIERKSIWNGFDLGKEGTNTSNILCQV